MGSFTRVCMSPTFPEQSPIVTIGSVTANFTRTSEEDRRMEFLRYSHGSAMADYVHDLHGTAAYEAYLDEMQRNPEAETMQPPKKQARRRSRCAAMKRFYRFLKAFVTKLTDC